MKSLQSYILEHIDNDVNEGKILDAIKEWFKKLFEPSDRKFDRYNSDNGLNGTNLSNYETYLKDNFDIKNIEIKKLDLETLKKIVYPNGEEPNTEEQIGFYEFIDNIDEKENNSDYFGLIYKDSEVKDTAVLLNSVNNGGKIEILKLQVIKEFINLLKLNDVIKLLKQNKEFIGTYKIMYIKQNTNKELYNQLINDCGFIEEYDKTKNENIAKLEIK